MHWQSPVARPPNPSRWRRPWRWHSASSTTPSVPWASSSTTPAVPWAPSATPPVPWPMHWQSL
eukprot:4578833-Pyramimonas_sp.AAC.1